MEDDQKTLSWIDSTLNWLSKDLPWKSVFAVFVLSNVLLFGAARLGIDKEIGPYRVWLVIALVFSGAWLAGRIGELATPYTGRAWRRFRGRGHLKHLTPEEKRFCKWFLDGDGKALPHNPANGAIASLLQNGILWKPERGWQKDQLFEFNIQPWALAYLRKHPKCVGEAKESAASEMQT